MTETTQDNQEPKKKKFLPKEARLMMTRFLESEGMMDIENKDDEDILKIYNESALKIQQKKNSYEVGAETKSLNQYANSNPNMRISSSNKEFIARLHRMSVPSIYLHLFKDDDAELKDRELWRIVNKSGIDPIKEVSQITKMKRSPVKPKVF